MSESPFLQEAILPREHLDIGPGGVIITSSFHNRELLKRLEQTEPLSPVELYKLANSYQNVASNSGLGNRLAFIALDNIFQHALVQQLVSTPPESLMDIKVSQASSSCPWYCAFVPSLTECKNCGPHPSTTRRVVKSVSYAGLELLIEATEIEDETIYVVLGVAPNINRF